MAWAESTESVDKVRKLISQKLLSRGAATFMLEAAAAVAARQ